MRRSHWRAGHRALRRDRFRRPPHRRSDRTQGPDRSFRWIRHQQRRVAKLRRSRPRSAPMPWSIPFAFSTATSSRFRFPRRRAARRFPAKAGRLWNGSPRKPAEAYFDLTAAETLEKIYGRIEDELRNQYSLGFTPVSKPSWLSQASRVGKTKGRDRPGSRRLLSGPMSPLRSTSVRAGFCWQSAAFAMAWAIARAAVQSITIDEAVTYNLFVFRAPVSLVCREQPHPELDADVRIHAACWDFRSSPRGCLRCSAQLSTSRAAYRLCRLLGASLFVQLTVFVCLVFNPFIFDHLVAARGYGLALAISDVGDGVFRRAPHARTAS